MTFSAQSLSARISSLVQDLKPPPANVSPGECLRITAGTLLAIGLIAWLGQSIADQQLDLFWHGASLASSALLIVAMPSNPLSQPWAVLVGTLASSAVGMLISLSVDSILLAAALSVPLSALVMIRLRAFHPPGAAAALYMVLAHIHDPWLLIFPLGFNLLALVILGMLLNRATGRIYPSRQVAPQTGDTGSISQSDIDIALARYNEVLAISRSDLTELLQTASNVAFKRHLGDLSCGDAMHVPVDSVPADMPLPMLRKAFACSHHKELPVVDKENRLLGSIGIQQWMEALEPVAPAPGDDASTGLPVQQSPQPAAAPSLTKRMLGWVGAGKRPGSSPAAAPAASGSARPGPALVRDIMIPSLVIATPEQPLLEIVPVLSQGGRYHVPVVDESRRLVGIITQTNLLATLSHALAEAGPAD